MALHIACEKGFFEIVQSLVENGANVNVIFWDGATPLFFASQFGSLKIVKYLVERGTNSLHFILFCYYFFYFILVVSFFVSEENVNEGMNAKKWCKWILKKMRISKIVQY